MYCCLCVVICVVVLCCVWCSWMMVVWWYLILVLCWYLCLMVSSGVCVCCVGRFGFRWCMSSDCFRLRLVVVGFVILVWCLVC